MTRFYTVLVVIGIGIVTFLASTFTVHETERALKLQLGEIVSADYDPGLHFRIPVYQNVYKFDSRVLTLDAEPRRLLTIEKKNLIVDAFVKWQIMDVVRFYNSTGGNENIARQRLHQFVRNQLADEFAKRTVLEVISGERAVIMDTVRRVTNARAAELGVTIRDVRIKKVELPESVRESVYQRMEQERVAAATEFRAEGREQAQAIRAGAEREAEEIRADARREGEEIRGRGDAEATRIFAEAHSEDPEFFGFYRSLQAYERVFDEARDVMVLEPDSEFFRYFGEAEGRDADDGGEEGDD